MSVIIPTYNYAQYLPDAINSVLNQTYEDFEIIVVDDGSTDDTQMILQGYQKKYPRVRSTRIENSGQGVAKNVGIKASSGSYIAFLDADDRWLPEKLSLQIEVMEKSQFPIVVYCRRTFIDQHGCSLPAERPTLYSGSITPKLLLEDFICSSTLLIPKEVFYKVGFFDESLLRSEDYDLLLRISLQYSFAFVDSVLVEYRMGHSSISQNKDLVFKSLRIIYRSFFKTNWRHLPLIVILKSYSNLYSSLSWYERLDRRNKEAITHAVIAFFLFPFRVRSIKTILGTAKYFISNL